MKTAFLLIAMLALITPLTAQSTDGIVTFSATTVSDGGTYAPRHVIAFWIKDATGNFVKSRKVMAGSRRSHLVKWVANSNSNVADAITGVTLTAHTTHSISWDCRNNAGIIVPDGVYEIWIEYTERNSASTGIVGPSISIPFTKGTSAQNPVIANAAYFKNMTLSYQPLGVFIDTNTDDNNQISMNPNPFANELNISLEMEKPGHVSINMYDISGKNVSEIYDGYLNSPKLELVWKHDQSAFRLKKGVYFIRTIVDGKVNTKKVVFADQQ